MVDLVEIDPGWRSYGAGISLGSPTLRAFERLGILDEFLRRGYGADGAELFTSAGHPIASLPTPRLAVRCSRRRRDHAPCAGAHSGRGDARVRRQRAPRRDLRADRASRGRRRGRVQRRRRGAYDLVIGADGLNSKTRATIFPDAPNPRYTGQCVWRAVLPRPPEVTCALMWLGRKVKAGVNPVSQDEMYLFVDRRSSVERLSHRSRAFLDDSERADRSVHRAGDAIREI